LWLLAGPNPTSANVFRVKIDGGAIAQETHNKAKFGVSRLSASETGVAVANASDGTDRLGMLDNGRFVPLNLGDPATMREYTPAISPDGAIAFVRAVYPPRSPSPEPSARTEPPVVVTPRPGSEEPSWEIVVRSPHDGSLRVLHHGTVSVTAPVWGPDGALAYLEIPYARGKPPRATVHVLDRAGQEIRSYDVNRESSGAWLVWGTATRTPLALADTNWGILFDMQTGAQTALPAQWTPQCWSPDGSSMLVARGTQLGLVRADRPAQATELGRFPSGNLYGCSWVPDRGKSATFSSSPR
jgi:hypothetical protein